MLRDQILAEKYQQIWEQHTGRIMQQEYVPFSKQELAVLKQKGFIPGDKRDPWGVYYQLVQNGQVVATINPPYQYTFYGMNNEPVIERAYMGRSNQRAITNTQGEAFAAFVDRVIANLQISPVGRI